MKYIRNILYAIVFLLFLEVVKRVVVKKELPSSYFIGTIMIAIQFLICLAILFTGIIAIFFHKRIKNNRKGILLAGGIFILIIAGMECLAVYWLKHPQAIPGFLEASYRYYYIRYDRNIIQYDGALATYDSSLFYKFKPGIKGRFGNAEFDTQIEANSLGLRDNESALQHPAIVCLGDSYTMGWGVEEEETFPKQLESLTGTKVLNGGMSSYGTARELIRLKMLDTTTLTNLIIQYCINDYDENDQYIRNDYKLSISPVAAYDSLVRMQHWNATYFPGKVFLTTAQIFIKEQINKLHPFFNLQEGEMNHPESKLQAQKFMEVLNGAAIDFQKTKIIVVFVDDYSLRTSTFPEELQKLAGQMPYIQKFAGGFQVVNMYRYLTEQDFYRLDTHLKPSGQKKIAAVLKDAIRK